LTSEYNLNTFSIENNTYAAGTFLGFWNQQKYTTLAAWRSATGHDI
jgi:hypothetical protein